MSTQVMTLWKTSLQSVLVFYDSRRGPLHVFFPLLFLFFIGLNISCYWWALITVFPSLAFGESTWLHYFKLQFPVGFLGALFDSVSFFVTIHIVRRALLQATPAKYIGHLSLDFVIAILATFWVLFVFSFSSWLLGILDTTPAQEMAKGLQQVGGNRDLASSSAMTDLQIKREYYEYMVTDAIKHPAKNFKNIYFGLVMGISAMLPTTLHIFMSIRALFKSCSSLPSSN